jgi:hypothetical protein
MVDFGRAAAAIAAAVKQRAADRDDQPEVVQTTGYGPGPQVVNHEIWINEALWPAELGRVEDPSLVGLVAVTWVDGLADVVSTVTLPNGGLIEGPRALGAWIEHRRSDDCGEGSLARIWSGAGSRPALPSGLIAGWPCSLSAGRLTTAQAVPWASVTTAACPCGLAAAPVPPERLTLGARAGEAWAATASWFALVTRPSLSAGRVRLGAGVNALRKWFSLIVRPGFASRLGGELR